jgi:hypothetical protein
MKTSLFLLIFFVCCIFPFAGNSQSDIVRAEYFFDIDPGFGNGTPVPITPGPAINLTFNANTGSLSPGYHKLYLRAQDSEGEWGITYFQPFFKPMAPPSPEVEMITQAEYFIDNDPGFGSGTPIAISPGAGINQDFNISLSGLASGYHRLYIRVKDSEEQWSVSHIQPFFKPFTYNNPPQPSLVDLEYYFDSDPGFGNGVSVPFAPQPFLDMTFYADVSALSVGIHKVFLRVQDANSQWSNTYIGSFFKEVAFPVELVSFSAKAVDEREVLLEWATASEIALESFTLERSAEGIHWSTIGKILPAGGIFEAKSYAWIDVQPLYGINYYRLKMVDYSGQFGYSKVEHVLIANVISQPALTLFPNPSSGQATLFLSGFSQSSAQIQLFDASGKPVFSGEIPISNAGQGEFHLPDVVLGSSGFYFISVQTDVALLTAKLIVL